MSQDLDDLALRKQLLVAQSRLYRSQLGVAALTMRSRASQLPFAGLLTFFAGRSAGRWIGTAGTVLAVARIALSALALFRRK
ncbi:MAG: hypothetical protein ABIQ72_04075 [Usitatibacter sp.]